MTEPVDAFRAGYEFAFRRYLEHAGESLLRVGYELGREAVGRELSVLDLAAVHHDVLLATVRHASTPADVARITEAAGDFFLESLSAYEMVRRGFLETQEAARAERRQAEMLRQLSSFLADASLAVDAAASAEEILQLVAEQARDLIGARWCVATVAVDDPAGGIRTVSTGAGGSIDDASAWPEAPWAFAAVQSGDDAPDGSGTRRSGGTPDGREAPATSGPATELLDAPLVALDGRRLGEIRLGGKEVGRFTGIDGAVLLHLAQMASAALERTRLYRHPS